MLKNIYSLIAMVSFLSISILATGQNNTDFDKRLLDKFSKKELKALSADELNYWTFYLENSFEVQSIPGGKEDGLHHYVTVKPAEMDHINILKLGLTPHKVARLYYGIEGTDKMIVLYGQQEIDDKFRAGGN